MNIPAVSLLAVLCLLPGGLCLAQAAPLNCSEIQYEAPIAEATSSAARITVDRLEGQAVFSVPEIPRMLGSVGSFCLGLFTDAPRVKSIASASTDGGGAFAFESVSPGDYVLIGHHASGEGGTIRLALHVSIARKGGPTRGLLLRVERYGARQSGRGEIIGNLELRQALLERYQTDQSIRMEMIAKGSANAPREVFDRMDRIDAQTDAMLSAILREHGWPGLDMVGLDGTTAASTLLQHVSAETKKRALPLVEAGFRAGNVLGSSYAGLVDTVRLAEGRLQLYGTAAKPFERDGEIVLQPVEDEANVDVRRAEMGLMPLEEYRKFMRELYYPQKTRQHGGQAAARGDSP